MKAMNVSSVALALVSTLALMPAQANESSSVEADEVLVVTGTRTEYALLDAPVKVEVITSDDIERQHAADLYESLKTIPGIQFKPVQGKNGVEAWIQGIDADRVLVLIDGEPISASTGSAVDLTQISASDVERVEVVKGAASVLYGSQAMGGVINVITAKPEEGMHGAVSVDVGSYGKQNPSGNESEIARQRINAKFSYASDDFYIALNSNARLSDGFQVDPNAWNQQGADGHKINSAIVLGFSPNDYAEYSIRFENYDQAQHTRLTTYKGFNRFEVDKTDDATRNRLSLKGEWQLDDWVISAQGFVEDYENISDPGTGELREAEMPKSRLDIMASSPEFSGHSISFGALLFNDELRQSKDGINELINASETFRNVEVFIQDDYQINDRFQLVSGLRHQDDSDFGGHTTAKISLRVDVNDDYFMRSSIGQAYRVPNLKERYFIFDHSHLGYKILGNDQLSPEESLSVQHAFVFSPNKDFSAELAFFYNDITDLIAEKHSHYEQGVQIFEYQNIQEAVTQGVELSGQYKFIDSLSLQAGYTYLDSENKQTGNVLDDRAKHLVKLGLDYFVNDRFSTSVLANWQDKAYQFNTDQATGLTTKHESEAWAQIDLKLNYLAYAGQAIDVDVYGGIDNLLDEQEDFSAAFDNRPTTGRVVYTGFKVSF